MSLVLVKRATNGVPITAVQNDANMTAIESAVNTNTSNISTNTTDISNRVTLTALNAMFEGYTVGGKQKVDYASITNVPTPVDVNTYPAAVYSSSTQTLSLALSSVSPQKITLMTSVYVNPDGKYNNSTTRYVAVAYGIYMITASVQIDNATGVAAQMEGYIKPGVNGATTVNGLPVGGFSVASPPGSRWYPQVSGLIELNTNDYVEMFVSAHDGTNTGNVTLSNALFSILKVK